MIRVFAVDDSPFVRKALKRALAATPDVRLVGEAATGEEALAKIPAADPHVVTLDVRMQGLDGLAVLRELLLVRPGLRVIMLSAHTQEGARITLDALALGAADFVDKQALNLMDLEGLRRELVDRIRGLAETAPPPPPVHTAVALPELGPARTPELCVIGASTGGPPAIQAILEALPASFPIPIAIVQHMPPGFTRAFAARLDGLCRLKVEEAREGERLERGRVFIAPGGSHLRLSSDLVASLTPEELGTRHTPSVDVLFRSAARAREGRVLGVLLTGMGSDGAEGLALIRSLGGITIAESAESCAVYGMPRAAAELGAAEHVLPLPAIAALLAQLPAGAVRKRTSPAR